MDSQNPYAPSIVDDAKVMALDNRRPRRLGVAFIVLLGLLLPGLPSIMLGRRVPGLLLLLTIPASFVFFGPIWGAYLFRGTPYSEWGFYPFVLTVCVIPIASVIHGLNVSTHTIALEAELDN